MKIFLEAIHGAPRDYTDGPVGKAVILLGIPMVLEMIMESVFVVTDIFFVGSLGPQAVATIGLTESLLTIVYTVAFGLSIGATAVMSRRVGSQDYAGASSTAAQTVYIGIIVSIIIALFGVWFAPELLALMGGTPDVVEYGASYMRIMFGGNITIILLFLGNAIFRGAGDGAIAMRALWLSNGLNVLVVPCLVHGLLFFPKMGVVGAAVATTICRGIGALYTLSHLFKGHSKIKVHKDDWKIDFSAIGKILKLSSSGTLQVFIGTASWVGLVRIVSNFGAEAVAGYTIGFRIIMFALFPAFGLGNAAATMVGQSLGAKKPERAEKAVWIAGSYNAVFLGAMGILFLVFAPLITGCFTQDAAVSAYSINCLRTVSCGFLFYAFGMVLTQSFNGAGDTWTPTVINLLVFWFFEIPLAYILANNFALGPQGVFLAVTIAFSVLAVVSGIVFRRGKWKGIEI